VASCTSPKTVLSRFQTVATLYVAMGSGALDFIYISYVLRPLQSWLPQTQPQVTSWAHETPQGLRDVTCMKTCNRCKFCNPGTCRSQEVCSTHNHTQPSVENLTVSTLYLRFECEFSSNLNREYRKVGTTLICCTGGLAHGLEALMISWRR
jgi:hypothetical protein